MDSNAVEKNEDYTEDNIGTLADKVEANRLSLIEQEHRLISVLTNLYKAKKSNCDKTLKAAIMAFIHRFFIPGNTVIIIGAGSFIGVMTILLMQQGNIITNEQNYALLRQIYEQGESDRRVQLVSITDHLYSATEESGASSQKRIMEKELTEKQAIVPKSNSKLRTVALGQLAEMETNPLEPPERKEVEIIIPFQKTICGLFNIFCLPDFPLLDVPRKGDDDGEVKDAHIKDERPVLDIRSALLMNIYQWPDTSGLNVLAYRANLSGADLMFGELRGADLKEADLSYTKLDAADLSEAILSGAILKAADLRRSDLSHAHLDAADLSGAILNGANLREADLRGAILHKTDLREVENLGCVQTEIVDLDSETKFPDALLAACPNLKKRMEEANKN